MPAPSFVWFELATSDPQAAAAFYERVLGVTASDATVPGGSPYLALLSAGGPVGGVMAFPPDLGPEVALPGWTGYIASTTSTRWPPGCSRPTARCAASQWTFPASAASP